MNNKYLAIFIIVLSGFGVYALHNYIVRAEISDARIGNIISFGIYLLSGTIFGVIKGRTKVLSNLYVYCFLLVGIFFDIQGLIFNELLFPVIVPISTMSKVFGFYLGYNVLKRTKVFYILLLICIPLLSYINLIYIPKIQFSKQNDIFIPKLKQVDYTLLRTQTDDTINRRSLNGKVVLLDFYFLNCRPCREKFPTLEKLKSAFKGRNDVEIIGVYCDVDNYMEVLPSFLKKNKITITTYVDKDLKLCKELGIKSYPVEVILNKEGEIVSTYYGFELGASDKYYKERIKLINDLLKAQ